MKALIPIALASLFTGCGLTAAPSTRAMAPPLAPTLQDALACAPLATPQATGEAGTAAGTTEATAPRDGLLAQAAPAMIKLGGALQQEDDAETQAGDDEWEVYFVPYAWLPRVSGSLTVKGVSSRLVITQGDLVSDLNSAWLIDFRAVKDDNFLRLDTVGMNLAKDDQGIPGVPNGTIDARVELAFAELDAGVQVLDEDEQSVVVFTGLRYVYIKARVNPKNVGIQGQSKSVDWVDPILGTQYRSALNDDWELLFHADYGGFGIGSASKSTYQLMGVAQWQASERWHIGGGWRYLMIQHGHGSGANKNEQHLRFSGPMLGASYRF
jgi:opacity protein-like surface antigen